jgi:multiple sugar transport system ATP-binding protein
MIAGLEEISDGELYIEGRLVNEVAPKDRDIAMVFQNYALYPHMSVYENMAFGLRIKKVDKAEIDRRVHEAARTLDIENFLERKPKALSGGQRQRVAVGRAIVRNPKVFLFDEPLSNLDAKLRVTMRKEINELHLKLNATMIYVTHDQVEAMTMASKIVVMKDGKVQQIGAPLNLYNHPINKFVAGFIGSPAMNLVDLPVGDGGVDFGGYTVPVDRDVLALAGSDTVTLGVRPESLALTSSSDENGVEMFVDIVEELGADAYLYGHATIDGKRQPLTVRTDGHHPPAVDTTVHVVPVSEGVHIFDVESGQRLSV